MRYILDRTHPLQVPCGGRGLCLGLGLVFALASKYLFSSPRPWECGNPEGISTECGKGGKPAPMAFHAFHTLSFPWPALEVRIRIRGLRNPRISGTSPSHFTLWSRQLALRLRVDLQSPRKIVPKGRPLEVLQSAENRRSNLICGAVPEGVGCETVLSQWLSAHRSQDGAV
jgi:hypothetical protein